MTRLTTEKDFCTYDGCSGIYKKGECDIGDECTFYPIYERLKYYEDLEEAGQLVKLPYKYGDWVYCLENEDDEWEYSGYIFLGVCKDYIIVSPWKSDDIDQQLHIMERNSPYDENDIKIIHKNNVFLTPEEAAAALKEHEK